MFGRTPGLALPSLARGLFRVPGHEQPLVCWTDEALLAKKRVRVAFTQRQGGLSAGPYASLNLATHVDDDEPTVLANRRLLLEALGLPGVPLVVPKQVHGERIVALKKASAQEVEAFRTEAGKGSDALLVEARGVAALMNFADCVPLVMVAPSGRFAVVHAGWRGVDNGIVVKALHKLVLGEPGLSVDASSINVYRGAYIHGECFEVSPELHQRFTERFGDGVAFDSTHIDLGRALDADLVRSGVDPKRIADVDACTVCSNGDWFSYRGQGGTCGRHAALCAALS